MGQKLIDWCEKNEIQLLAAITTDRVMKFRMSLPFRTGDSSSLKVHWAVINGFFNARKRVAGECATSVLHPPTPSDPANPVLRRISRWLGVQHAEDKASKKATVK